VIIFPAAWRGGGCRPDVHASRAASPQIHPRFIGGVVARSDGASFETTLERDVRIQGVADSSQPVGRMGPVETGSHDEQPPELPNAPAGQDNLDPLQWHMRQIHHDTSNQAETP